MLCQQPKEKHLHKSNLCHICIEDCRELLVHSNNLVALNHPRHQGYQDLLVISNHFAPLKPKFGGQKKSLISLKEAQLDRISKFESLVTFPSGRQIILSVVEADIIFPSSHQGVGTKHEHSERAKSKSKHKKNHF